MNETGFSHSPAPVVRRKCPPRPLLSGRLIVYREWGGGGSEGEGGLPLDFGKSARQLFWGVVGLPSLVDRRRCS